MQPRGNRAMKSQWKKEYAGRYVSTATGYVIERSYDFGGWNVINPVTGGVQDNLPTLKEAKKYYG